MGYGDVPCIVGATPEGCRFPPPRYHLARPMLMLMLMLLGHVLLCGSMLEEMNKMNDENAILREEKKTFAARLQQQQQQQLQDAQTAARARQTATRYGMMVCLYFCHRGRLDSPDECNHVLLLRRFSEWTDVACHPFIDPLKRD